MEAATQARDSDARAILVRAEGDNFSAGANVEMFLDRDEAAARELIDEFIPGIRRFAEISVPTVAAVQGLCLAAGLEVALSCDLIWAAEGCQPRSGGGGDRGHAVRWRDTAARRAGGCRPRGGGGPDRHGRIRPRRCSTGVS